MRRWRLRTIGCVAGLLLAAAVAACAGDDGGSETLPPDITDATTTTTATSTVLSRPPSTTAPPTTTTAPTTTPPTTTGTPPPIETLVPTDPDAEDVFIVGQQYLAGRQALRELLLNPTLDDLENRVAGFAQPGSEYYELSLQAVRDLVASGLRFAPNDPSVNLATIEVVDFEGSVPYQSAVLQTCDISNDLKVAADGSVAEPGFDGTFNTIRERFHVVLTDRGWVRDSRPIEVVGTYRGQDSCGPM